MLRMVTAGMFGGWMGMCFAMDELRERESWMFTAYVIIFDATRSNMSIKLAPKATKTSPPPQLIQDAQSRRARPLVARPALTRFPAVPLE